MSDDLPKLSYEQQTQPHLPRVDFEDHELLTQQAGGQPHPPAIPGNAPSVPAAGGSPYGRPPHGGPLSSGPAYGYDPQYGAAGPRSAARDRDARRRGRPKRSGGWAWVIVALALFGVTLVVSLSVFLMLRGRQNEDSGVVVADNGLTPLPVIGGGLDGTATPTFATPAALVTAVNTAVVVVPTLLPGVDLGILPGGGGPGGEPLAGSSGIMYEPWNGEERFTVLVMGWDKRPGESGNAFRTDTMMVVSFNPADSSIGVLSIPRDLYVEIPGFPEYQRINSAVVYGELREVGYGPTLAMLTVMRNLGIRIHDYLILDFNTFITFVDAIGGVDIDNPVTINDPQYPNMNYGYEPFYLSAGQHHLDGATALKYARTRHGSSDFRRAERQQQILLAIRDRVLSWSGLPQFLLNGPRLWAEVQTGVQTGLAFDQLVQLALYAKDVPPGNVHMGVIDEQYITYYQTASGQSVVIPVRSRIGPLMVEVFGADYAE